MSAVLSRADGVATEPVPCVLDTARGPVEIATFGEGPAVIALHGAMGGFDQSLILAKAIGAPGFHYIAVSRPGYLGTPLSIGSSPQQQADVCAAVLDALKIGRAAVMAVSGGGPCALHFALRHTDRCRGLVLVSTCAEAMTTKIPLGFAIMTFLARFSPLVGLLRRRMAGDPRAAARRSIRDPGARARVFADPVAGPLFTALLTGIYDRLGQRLAGTENDIRVTRSGGYPLERIAVPTLVVHGTADSVVPFAEHGEQLARRIPGAEALFIEGGEHVALFTDRDRVASAVARFLAATA